MELAIQKAERRLAELENERCVAENEYWRLVREYNTLQLKSVNERVKGTKHEQ